MTLEGSLRVFLSDSTVIVYATATEGKRHGHHTVQSNTKTLAFVYGDEILDNTDKQLLSKLLRR